jgi:hypothetical protein
VSTTEFGGEQLWAAEEKKSSFDSKEFVKAANDAQQRGPQVFAWFQKLTLDVLKKLWSIAKQAVEIAVSKFLLELCAMVISAVGASIYKKYSRHVDITTPGVSYTSSGGATMNNSSSSAPPQNLWTNSGSPFDSGWGSSRAGAW